MTNELVTLLNGTVVGHLRYAPQNRTTFIYDDTWRKDANAYPISLSMPLTAREHEPDVVEGFLWGLLPDNETVLQRWATKYQVSARNVFALISHVGEDCAGAVQFVSPDRLKTIELGGLDTVEWLTEAQVAERLRILREDHAAWRLPRDTGQFSLAGAQPKTALLFERGQWGIPYGRIPTTHILKPPTGEYNGHAENEHVCLGLARNLGLPTASSRVHRFQNEVAIVVERYDRYREGDRFVRVHQEDICQALGLPPTQKYQNEGGPGIADVVNLLNRESSARAEDVETFVSAIALNWLIAGTDAHAKNYSFLLASGPRVRLAPLYDIASALPYDNMDLRKLKMAMKVGGEYKVQAITSRQWAKLALQLRMGVDELLARIAAMARQIPDQIEGIRKEVRNEGLEHTLIDTLADRITERAIRCRNMLERAQPNALFEA